MGQELIFLANFVQVLTPKAYIGHTTTNIQQQIKDYVNTVSGLI